MAFLGYARASSTRQAGGLDRQQNELRAAGCERIWTDAGVSGTVTQRPELDALLDYARDGDTIVVPELSRLGRTVRQLVVLVDDLGKRGIGVRSLTQAPGDRTTDLASRAAARGLLVRPFAGEGVRVSIGSPEANDAVLALTAEWAPIG
jgi:DNA invertase Pin-like site-specific DNA recombinase